MMWTALCAGVVAFVAVSRVAGGARRVCSGAAPAALRLVGASGMFALAFATAAGGFLLAAGVSLVCGLVLTLDPLAAWRRIAARLPRGQASTVTPFQNAT